MHRTADFGEDRERIRIPFEQDLVGSDGGALFHQNLGAVNHVVAFLLTALLVHHDDLAVTVHGDQFAGLVADGGDAIIQEARKAVRLGVLRRLFGNTCRRSTNVECAHRQLCSRLADRLRCDYADSLAAFDQAARREVAPVTGHADASFGFAGQHRTDLDSLDARRLNQPGEFLGDFLVHADNEVAFEIFLIFKHHAAHNAVAQGLDDLAGFDDGLNKDTLRGAAIVLGDDHVLRDIHQPARQVAGVGGFQRRVGQTFAGAVGSSLRGNSP